MVEGVHVNVMNMSGSLVVRGTLRDVLKKAVMLRLSCSG